MSTDQKFTPNHLNFPNKDSVLLISGEMIETPKLSDPRSHIDLSRMA